jgi:hypothetical protein
MAALQIEWKKFYRGDQGESRDARLDWLTYKLRLKRPLESTRDLSDRQIGLALDELRKAQRYPMLPNAEQLYRSPVAEAREANAKIIHLASDAQVYTIQVLFHDLGWSPAGQRKFLEARYKHGTAALLKPRQAHSLIAILLNIIASRDLKTAGYSKITRAQMVAHVPEVKQRLGIDQRAKQSAPPPTQPEIFSQEAAL